jgi:hypothetical protein
MDVRIPLVCWIVVAFACAAARPVVAAPQRDASQPSMRTQQLPERHPNFPCVVALLERIVEDAQARGPQRLYVGPWVDPREQSGAGAIVRVYWPEDNAILLIGWPASCSEEDMRIDDAALGWYRTKARIDLDTDVVATPEDIGGSTYLVDRAWADRVIAACRRGHLLVVEPRLRD